MHSYFSHSVSVLAFAGAGRAGRELFWQYARFYAGKYVQLYLYDISDKALIDAKEYIEKHIKEAQLTGWLTTEQAESLKKNVHFTGTFSDLKKADIFLEAVSEDALVKQQLFASAEKIFSTETIFLSDSSHIPPETIFASVKEKKRCLIAHHFYPSLRNPVIELATLPETDSRLPDDLSRFWENMGKFPIQVSSRFAFALSPVFEGLCIAAIYCVEKGLANEKQVDKVAHEVLGMKEGPFQILQKIKANKLLEKSILDMRQHVSYWFDVPGLLQTNCQENKDWQIAHRDENVEIKEHTYKKLSDLLQGAYFAMAARMLENEKCPAHTLNIACQLAFNMHAPFTMMNKAGFEKVEKQVLHFCKENPGFPFPSVLKNTIPHGRWELIQVEKKRVGNCLLLKICRPKEYNALTIQAMQEIYQACREAEKDKQIDGIVITGFGPKAFAFGMDIEELKTLQSGKEAKLHAAFYKDVLQYIRQLKKPVVCALNGAALGLGNELALSCTVRIAKKGMALCFSHPEVCIGSMPGAGATQLLPRLLGIEKAAHLLRTGESVSAEEALKLGYVYKLLDDDLIERGIALIEAIKAGNISPKKITEDPLTKDVLLPDFSPATHLSKKVDALICRAVYEGAHMRLPDALELETNLLGECFDTQDRKIGLETFLKKGLKAKAAFIHA